MPNKAQAQSDVPAITAAAAGSADIAVRLRKQILKGHYEFGERLPPERQLASYFGTSRSTVREALRQLERTNLITRRMGSGTFVSYREYTDEEEIAETTSPVELMEVRFAVEPSMVRLAVLNSTARDLERFRQALEQVEASDKDPDEFSRADEAFHLTLADCSRNPLMVRLYRHINDVRGHNQWSARKDKILTIEHIAEYNRQHRRLYEAVATRDMEDAVRTITRHLEKARADLLGVDKGHDRGGRYGRQT